MAKNTSRPLIEPLADSIVDTATRIGIGRSKVYDLLNAGKLKSIKIGRRRLVTRDSQRELLSSLAA
jgi:excisionase family DNA binding protein